MHGNKTLSKDKNPHTPAFENFENAKRMYLVEERVASSTGEIGYHSWAISGDEYFGGWKKGQPHGYGIYK